MAMTDIQYEQNLRWPFYLEDIAVSCKITTLYANPSSKNSNDWSAIRLFIFSLLCLLSYFNLSPLLYLCILLFCHLLGPLHPPSFFSFPYIFSFFPISLSHSHFFYCPPPQRAPLSSLFSFGLWLWHTSTHTYWASYIINISGTHNEHIRRKH